MSSSSTDKQLPPQSVPTPAYLAICAIFVLSGAAALVYQVVWTRQLTTFFGSSLYGVATVLSAFMGGLALGSWLIGKRADAMRMPLVAYGLFELGIGASALVFPYVLRATQPLIGHLYVTGGESTFLLFTMVRFVVVFALLLVPTTLMGATLPVLSRAVTNNMAQVGRSVGALYALNTLGAVVGVLLAGFYLIEHLGVAVTTYLAVGANLVIALISILMGRTLFQVEPARASAMQRRSASREVADDRLSPATMRLVLASYALSGLVALAYQVCWTRAMIFSLDTLKSTTYAFSGMLLVFLLGLAIGSAIMQAIVDRQQNLLRLYALLQMGIGLGGGLSFFVVIADMPALTEISPDGALIYGSAVLNVIIKSAATIGLPTLLMGMAFPVVTRIVVTSTGTVGGDVARVYALNTLGAIAGSFLCGFVFIPLLGITGTIGALAAVNLAMAAALFWKNGAIAQRERVVLTVIAIGAAVLVPARIGFSGVKLQRIQANEKIVHYEEGAMATISVVENNSGDRMIYVDDTPVAGTDKIMLTDQKSLAHVPMALLGGRADRVLSVGFGSGGASYSYTLYPGIKEIRTIEIAPEVLRAAPTLTDSNHGIIVPDAMLAEANAAGAANIRGFRNPNSAYIHTAVPGFKTFDPRFKVLVDDARAYLRFSKLKYDVIATDCTDLRYKTNANLYDLEYFTLCRDAITDRGLVVVWMPLAGLSDRAFRVALRTFQEVFPEMGVWYFTNQPTHYCLLIGGKGPVRISYDDVREATSLPRIADDLDEIGLRDPDKLISSFVCDERTLTKHLAGFPLNTENNPIIEFESPRFGYDSRPLRDNQKALFEIQVPAEPLLVNLPMGTADRIWKLQQANYVVFEGHCAYREYDYARAAGLYEQALAMVPWDTSIKRLLDFEELKRHFDTTIVALTDQNFSNVLATGGSLGQVFYRQKRYSEAVTVASQTLAIMAPYDSANPPDAAIKRLVFGLHWVLAQSYAASGQKARAEEYAKQAQPWAATAEQWTELNESIGG